MSRPEIIGRRVYPDLEGQLRLAEGDFGQGTDGIWYARPPGNHMGSLERHVVTEHPDGTITVNPSILIDDGRNQWHGYLVRGIWRECPG